MGYTSSVIPCYAPYRRSQLRNGTHQSPGSVTGKYSRTRIVAASLAVTLPYAIPKFFHLEFRYRYASSSKVF